MENLISASGIIKQSSKIYKEHFTAFFKIIALYLLPIILLLLLSFPLGILEPFSTALNFFAIAAVIVLGIWINIAIIKMTQTVLKNEKTDFVKVANEAWTVFWSYLWVSILVGVITLLGTIALVIPGIIFFVWFAFSALAVVLDGKKGNEALFASKAVVKGRFFSVLWRLLAPNAFFGIAMLVSIFVLEMVVGALLGDWEMMFRAEPVWWFEFISNAASIFFAPLFIITTVILYNGLKQTQKNESVNA